MTIFLILAPYGVFGLLLFATSATVSLFAAAGTCLVAMAIDAVRGRSIKILGAGSAAVFAGLGLYLLVWHPTWSNSAVSSPSIPVSSRSRSVRCCSAAPSHCNMRSRPFPPKPRRCPAFCAPTTSSPAPGPRRRC